MIPKKIFSPKCLHPDRDTVFSEDLNNFFTKSILNSIYENNTNTNNSTTNTLYPELISYSSYKNVYKTNRISMLHFSKSKEENTREFYQVLYGEIQLWLFYNTHFSLYSIYTLYSIYQTQPYKDKYKINTNLECLERINTTLISIKEINPSIFKEVYSIVQFFYSKEIFSIGILIGLKTILLNKYGVPYEPKACIYKDYVEISKNKSMLCNINKNLELRNDYISNSTKEYVNHKNLAVDSIKEFFNEYKNDFVVSGNNGNMYNNNTNMPSSSTYNNINNSNKVSDINLYCNVMNKKLIKDGKVPNRIMPSDMSIGEVTNLDHAFNQIDDFGIK